jgi:hypothetical protein
MPPNHETVNEALAIAHEGYNESTGMEAVRFARIAELLTANAALDNFYYARRHPDHNESNTVWIDPVTKRRIPDEERTKALAHTKAH